MLGSEVGRPGGADQGGEVPCRGISRLSARAPETTAGFESNFGGPRLPARLAAQSPPSGGVRPRDAAGYRPIAPRPGRARGGCARDMAHSVPCALSREVL